MSGTVIGSMDSYIVNTSMPRVLGDLGEPQYYAWVASAWLSITAIFGLAALIALFPATLGRPKVRARAMADWRRTRPHRIPPGLSPKTVRTSSLVAGPPAQTPRGAHGERERLW